MKLKYLSAVIWLTLFGTCAMYASSISFMVMQKSGSKKDITATSKLFEQSILDYFYDHGYIVSDTPLCSTTDEENETEHKSLQEAKDGFFDYFVVIQIELEEKKSKNQEDVLLENIKHVSWKIISVPNDLEIFSGNSKNGSVLKDGNDDKGIYQYAAIIADQIHEELLNQSEV